MKRIIIFLLAKSLLSLPFISVNAQTITLNWEGTKEVFNSKKLPYFNNENYSVVEGIPTLYYSEKTNNTNNITLSQLQWQVIDKKLLGDLSINEIPEEEIYSASITTARDNTFKNIVIKTLKKEGNTVYQLKSFTIQPSRSTKQTFASFNSTESILAQGEWYKIKVKQSGIYKIDRKLLQTLGINTNSLNPKTIRIFGNGGKMLPEPTSDFRYDNLQENAISITGENDGVFNNEDYILFYAQGPDFWDRSNNANIRHRKNIYEDYAYYFINVNQSIGKRISTQPYQTPNSTNYTEFNEHKFFEEDVVNLNQLGKIWLGENLSQKNNKEINFPVTELVTTQPISWRYYWVSRNGTNSKVNVLYNNNTIFTTTLTPSSLELQYSMRDYSSQIMPQGNQVKFVLNFDNSANPMAELYPDYFEALYKLKLKFNGSQMNFRTFDPIEDGKIYGFNFITAENFEVWNVSDIVNAQKLQKSAVNNNYSYQSTSTIFKNELVAFTPNSAYTPETVGRVSNQALHGITDADYIIITVPEFVSQANRLKNIHQTKNNLKVEIVTINQIYNEFSSGGQDLTAVRDFLRYLYKKDNQKLKYVLLLGSTSYDLKNKTKSGYNLIPTYQSYNSSSLSTSFATDDFITILDDNEANMLGQNANLSSSQLDIAVGRMIAKNISEATICVDKAIKYFNGNTSQGTPFGDWRLKNTLIVDIDYRGSTGTLYNFHKELESTVAQYLETSLPEYTTRKLYTDAFSVDYSTGGARFPSVTEAIKTAVNNGSLIINYFGHGGPASISQYRLFTKEDINNLLNFTSDYSKLPLFITVTCDISVWDNPSLNSFGDLLYLKNNGGAGFLITTNREISITYGLGINLPIVKGVTTKDSSGKNYIPLGEALRQIKVGSVSGEDQKITFLGDPAQPLLKPIREIRLNTINGVDAASFTGTIRALDFVTLEGEVLNETGAIDASFNGNLQTVLYDKPILKKTLNNFNYAELNPPMEYEEQVNSIFKGNTQVKNGKFKIEFYIPKDINYTIGEGKLVLYADNKVIDALYTKNDLKIGDINPDGINDNNPPKIGLFMNNLNFANSGITDNSPYLLACVTDDTGINSSGVGIGHDITAILDENVNATIVLNEFFNSGESSPCTNSDLKDYQKGKVWYRLYDLPVGKHSIKFKVWDINNNSATATLDFLVVENGNQGLVVKRLLNWPNPFTTKTFFHFEHNCPELLEVQVQIFTVSGKLVKTINRTITSTPFHEGYRTDKYGIEWDGLDDFGDKIGKGVYIYRVKVRGISETCKGSVSQVEKLVILK